MPISCVRCGTTNPDVACFCRNCGQALEGVDEGAAIAGRTPHRNALPAPAGFIPVDSAADLHYHWQAASGGAPLLGTETLAVAVFNGGYDLAQVSLEVRGVDTSGEVQFTVQHDIDDWPRGRMVQFEIPSYELPDLIDSVSVELLRADFH